MEYGALAMGKELAEKAVKRTEKTEVTNTERVGYTVNPIMQGTIDLVQGDSLAEVGDKMIKTTVENGKAVADVAKDCTEGPVPKWALPFTGFIGCIVNALSD